MHPLLRLLPTTRLLRFCPCVPSVSCSTHVLPTLTLFTKPVCPLCDDAKELLGPHLHKFHFEEVDITSAENREQWFGKYRYEIPVFHLNGKFLVKNRMDIPLLLQKLKELEN